MQISRVSIAALTALASICISLTAQASYREPSENTMSRVEFDAPTLAPLAYTRFCRRYEEECTPKYQMFVHDAELVLPEQQQAPFVPSKAEAQEINRMVNRSIAPRRYVGAAPFDSWTIAPKAGDCNDYAITKRSLLRQKGWPPERLLLAEVVIPSGEHHLVLVVRLDSEDLVLDNLTGALRPWSRTPYQWVRVQSPQNGAIWSTVRKPAELTS